MKAKKRKTRVVVVANQKGGCGKTTSVLNLAAALALKGKKVSVIDCDQQTNATQGLGLDLDTLPDDRFTVVDAYLASRPMREIERPLSPLEADEPRLGGNLWLAAGSRGMSGVQIRFDAQINEMRARQAITDLDADSLRDEQRLRLKDSVDSLRGERDFVFIDTGPDLGFALTTALIAADFYLVPVIPSAYDIEGLKMLLKVASQIRDRYATNLSLLGVLLCRVKGTTLDREIRGLLSETFGKGVFKTEIGDSVRYREATFHHVSIHEHVAGDAAPALSYARLADEVLKRTQEAQASKTKKPRKTSRKGTKEARGARSR